MPQKPETRFKLRVASDLKKLPRTWFVKIQQVAIRGIPDFLLCINGRFVALELKAHPQAHVSPLQDWTLKEIARTGGIALITFPSNWSDTYLLLQEVAGDESEDDASYEEEDDPDSRVIEVNSEKVSKKMKN